MPVRTGASLHTYSILGGKGSIHLPGGVFMCRKTYLRGCCIAFFGLGLIFGHCLESWFVCCCGGTGLVFLGVYMMKQK